EASNGNGKAPRSGRDVVKPKAFAALAVVTALMLVVAVSSYVAQNRFSQVRVSGAALFPGLAAQAERISKIVITQGDKTLTLARSKDTWLLADRADYPAKAQSVRALLIKLAQAELVEAKTRSKERYGILELEDPGAAGSKSHLVRLLDDKGAVIAEAVIGKKRSEAFGSSKGGTYVRKPGEAQTWLANGEIDVPLAARDWVRANILDIPEAKIVSLTIEMPGEQPLKIVRDAAEANKHVLAAMPNGKKLKDTFTIGAIVRAAGSIELEDVRKLSSAPGNASIVRLEADGGLAVTLRLRKEGEDYWLSAEATGSDGDAKKA